MGIAAAKVPSSSLDKITAEWLEEEIIKTNPTVAARLAPKAVEEKIVIIHAPPPSTAMPIAAASDLRDALRPQIPSRKESVNATPIHQDAIPVSNHQPSPPEPTLKVKVLPPATSIPVPAGRFTSTVTLPQIQSKIAQHSRHQQGVAGGRYYSAKSFENDVNRLLDELFLFSILPGIRLFSSEPRGRIDYGFEMDNLFHLRHKEIDYIVEVEVKHQPVQVDKGRWWIKYDDGQSCAREQVDTHIRTMWEYLRPIARQTELKFIAIVVSSDLQTARYRADGYRNAELHLCSINDLPALLVERFNFNHSSNLPIPEVLRVPQSSFLDLLRLSLPVEQLGHPELASAIRYVDRCRRTLDETLFQKFAPTPARWVINGSAGMGKSVLLAYTAAVLSSGFEIYRALGEVGVKKATETFTKISFNPDPKRGSIVIMAMSAKQLENIRGWFSLFVEQFQQADFAGDVRFRPPEFLLCRPGGSISGLAQKCSALLVDEAHDIPTFAARELAELNEKNGIYLVVACDRHQKLRLAGPNAKIIEGLDFTNRSTWLRQIYRNPAPIYIASLALMFRWFASDGPKVIPTVSQLDVQFGFDAKVVENGLEVLMRSDAHPANSWCHTVASFPNAAAAYSALIKENLGHKAVLWVRFSEEDPDFDYEQLIQHFTYHNCRGHDAYKISDKYIKGQDYPIVVIEGFPGFMDRFEASSAETAESAESRAWAFRRELYLCASRATSFLYFICNVAESPEILRIRNEIKHLVESTATPEKSNSGGTKSWKFIILQTTQVRKVDVFAESSFAPKVEASPESRNLESKTIVAQVTIASDSGQKQPSDNAKELPKLSSSQQNAPVKHSGATAPSTLPSITNPKEEQSAHTSAPDSITADQPKRVAPDLKTAPMLETKSARATNFDSLGEVATLSEVAKFLQKDIAEVSAKMAGRGLSNVAHDAKVSVKFVVGLFKEYSLLPPKGVFVPNRELAPASNPKAAILPDAKFNLKLPSPSAPSPRIIPNHIETSRTAFAKSDNNQAFQPPNKPILELPEQMTVKELADAFSQKPFAIIAELMKLRVMATVNQQINFELISRVAARYGYIAKRKG